MLEGRDGPTCSSSAVLAILCDFFDLLLFDSPFGFSTPSVGSINITRDWVRTNMAAIFPRDRPFLPQSSPFLAQRRPTGTANQSRIRIRASCPRWQTLLKTAFQRYLSARRMPLLWAVLADRPSSNHSNPHRDHCKKTAPRPSRPKLFQTFGGKWSKSGRNLVWSGEVGGRTFAWFAAVLWGYGAHQRAPGSF